MSQNPHDKAPDNKSAFKAAQFKKGQSGNPGGRPKGGPRFRAQCRAIAEKAIGQLEEMLDAKQLEPEQIVAVVKELGDRGGYLPADRLANAQVTWLKAALAALDVQSLDADARTKVLAELQETTTEALGLEGEKESE